MSENDNPDRIRKIESVNHPSTSGSITSLGTNNGPLLCFPLKPVSKTASGPYTNSRVKNPGSQPKSRTRLPGFTYCFGEPVAMVNEPAEADAEVTF